jgi:hypothetical protein
VPNDFLGICFMRYPVSGTSPIGLVKWGSCRLSQSHESRWSAIETSAGVYSSSALAALDSVITFQRQNGATVYGGLYATPVFYAGSTPNPMYADKDTRGPWNLLAEGAYPTSLLAVTAFVTFIINRYNKPGGAWFDVNGAALGKGIQYWEPWNEPDITFNNLGQNGNTLGSNQRGYGFSWMTAGQMTDLCAIQYAAVKAIDSSVIVISPGFASAINTFVNTFLTSPGSVTGKKGIEVCEEFAWHPYNHTPPLTNWPVDMHNTLLSGGNNSIALVKSMLAANGAAGMPLRITEWGVHADAASPFMSAWYATSAERRRQYISRILMTAAACGIKTLQFWNWEMTSNIEGTSGNWQGDLAGVQQAFNEFAVQVCGKTIVNLLGKADGALTLQFTDGTSYQV